MDFFKEELTLWISVLMRYALSTGETSSKPAGSAPQGSKLKSGWMKTGFVNKAIIIGNGNSDSRLMTR